MACCPYPRIPAMFSLLAHLKRKRDIRLGDVLFCLPEKASCGIIHHDLGKDADGGFLVNGRQVETPAIVRSAIGNILLMRKNPFRDGSQSAMYLAAFQAKSKDPKFGCQMQDKDGLLTSLQENEGSEALIEREPRDPSESTQVWYGNLGSENSMMRDPRRRDQLRDDHDLIGLEIEAAGVMNTLPTGVIRGVCDYADGHKNKDWQPYAAATAAAYSKGILYTISPRAGSPSRQATAA